MTALDLAADPTRERRRGLGGMLAGARGRRLTRRIVQLYAGLVAYTTGMALLLRSDLGNMPWDVLHQGLARRVGFSIGFWVIALGLVILLLWIPLRERPGIGTLSNILVIGFLIDPALRLLPEAHHLWLQLLYLVLGVVVNALATGLYVGARMGPGPRDGLMTGLVRRTGRSIRLVRSSIEVAVVIAGFALGGRLGVGTIVYAAAVGPLVHFFLPRLTVSEPAPQPAIPAADTLAE